jgi:hypothetical protein
MAAGTRDERIAMPDGGELGAFVALPGSVTDLACWS